MANPIRLKLITRMVRQREGLYRTVASLTFQDRAYEEGDICGYDAEGVIVDAHVSRQVLDTLVNQQRGDDVAGRDPVEMSVVNDSVVDEETGQPIDVDAL